MSDVTEQVTVRIQEAVGEKKRRNNPPDDEGDGGYRGSKSSIHSAVIAAYDFG
jgi:hypothetical protein